MNSYTPPGSRHQYTENILSHIIKHGDIDALKLAIKDSGSDVNLKDDTPSESPLILLAARHANYRVLDYLLSQDVDVNATNTMGTTALSFLAINGMLHKSYMRKLIEFGANPYIKSTSGKTLIDYLEDDAHRLGLALSHRVKAFILQHYNAAQAKMAVSNHPDFLTKTRNKAAL